MGNHIDSLIREEMKQEIAASVSRSKRKKTVKVVTELKEKSPLKRGLQRAALFTALFVGAVSMAAPFLWMVSTSARVFHCWIAICLCQAGMPGGFVA